MADIKRCGHYSGEVAYANTAVSFSVSDSSAVAQRVANWAM